MRPIGIDFNWKTDFVYGIILGGGFIFLNMLNPAISIGFPLFFFAQTWENFMIVAFVAPCLEEPLFRGVLLNILNGMHGVFKGYPITDKYINGFIVAVIFSLFHWTAYGLALSAAFFGAMLFGIMTMVVVYRTNSLLPAIVMHIIVNAYLLNQVLHAFVISGV